MRDTFLTWSTQYSPEDGWYTVRLDEMTVGDCKSVWALDYGRFKTWQEAHDYVESLANPYEAYWDEQKVFKEPV